MVLYCPRPSRVCISRVERVEDRWVPHCSTDGTWKVINASGGMLVTYWAKRETYASCKIVRLNIERATLAAVRRLLQTHRQRSMLATI
jgi:hypothetical protein